MSDAHLVALLERAVEEQRCEAILLSGGLDTSIVATLGATRGLRLAVTVVVDDTAPDLPYAIELAPRLGLQHLVRKCSLAELAARLPELVRILGTFDGMYLRNDVVVYEGLRAVADRGVRSCWTGDGADELFAGYSFVFQKAPEEVERTVRRFATTMHFNGPAIGERHAYRRKDPIEIGSGATALGAYLRATVEEDFTAEAARVLAADGVVIRDPEHLAYYRIYRRVFGAPPSALSDPGLPKECPGCHARGPEGTYCRVCGAYPI